MLVLGGGYAGVLAASRVAGRLGRRATVTLLEGRDDLVHRVRLHEVVARGPGKRHPLADILHRRVRHVRARATAIHARDHVVELSDGTKAPFDQLIVAVGSSPAGSIPGAITHGGALVSPERAAEAFAKLEAMRAGDRVVVIGGGLSGVEVAAEIAESHPRLVVTLLAGRILPGVSDGGRAYAEQALAALGVVRLDDHATAIDAGGVELASGEHLDAGLVVWAGGFSPAGVAIESDLPRDEHGRLTIDGTLRAVGRDAVWIVGDAAAPPPGLSFARMGCALAMPMGAHAADNVVAACRGRAPQTFRFGYAGQCISLGRKRGLIQLTTPDDRPREPFHSGRIAAFVKELVCSYVTGSLRIERLFGGAYTWPRRIEARIEPGPAGDARLAAAPVVEV